MKYIKFKDVHRYIPGVTAVNLHNWLKADSAWNINKFCIIRQFGSLIDIEGFSAYFKEHIEPTFTKRATRQRKKRVKKFDVDKYLSSIQQLSLRRTLDAW